MKAPEFFAPGALTTDARDTRRAEGDEMQHDLKTWPRPYQAFLDGDKLHEVRSTRDRNFAVGDVLRLLEWDPDAEEFTGREAYGKVTYLTHLQGNFCVMSVRRWGESRSSSSSTRMMAVRSSEPSDPPIETGR